MKRKSIFIIILSFLVFSLVLGFPYFSKPNEVVFVDIEPNNYYSSSGLWYMLNTGYHGYAFAFQDKTSGTYDTGKREQGSFVYGPFTLPDYEDLFLAFEYLWETEISYRNDIMKVEVSDNPIEKFKTLLDNRTIRQHHPMNVWDIIENISLQQYRGKTIYLRFSFDTMNDQNNNYKGWLVDNIFIYRNHLNSVFNSKAILDFSFDERYVNSQQVLDHSLYRNHGKVIGTVASHLEKNQVKRYFYFDAQDKIEIPAHSAINKLKATLFSFWFYPTNYGILAGKKDQFKIYYASPGRLYFQVYDGKQWNSLWTQYTLPLNNWYQIAILYDGSDQAAIFINGDGSKNMFAFHHCGNMASSNNDLYIGGSWDTTSLSFTGSIGDFKIADLSEWLTSEVNIKQSRPWPAEYSWNIYGSNDWLLAESNFQNKVSVDDGSFGGSLDLSNTNIIDLAQSIGVPTNITRDPQEIWQRLQLIWQWLQQNELNRTDPNYYQYLELLDQGTPNGWPSIQLRADLFKQFGGYVWQGSCGAHSQFFNSLMRLAGIDPNLIAAFQAIHLWPDGTTPGHAYSGVYLYNRWLPLDASSISRTFPSFPEVTTITGTNQTIDYAHPWTMKVTTDNNKWQIIPILEKACYPNPISGIKIVSPAHGAILDQEVIMVAGYFKGPNVSIIPENVIINAKKVQVKNGYFITSLKTEFINNEMVIQVTDPVSADTSSISIFKEVEILHAVNIGGGAYTDVNGVTFDADTSSSGTVVTTTNAIENTEDDTLYQSQRQGNLIFSFPVPNGEYDVVLKFAELGQSIYRAFQVRIEGILALPFVQVANGPGFYFARDFKVPVTVSDGTIDIRLAPIYFTPMISAILIRKALNDN